MSGHVWCMLASLCLISVGAEPQSYFEFPVVSSTPAPAPVQTSPQPDLSGKEIVLLLTPNQVESLQAAGAVVRPVSQYESELDQLQGQIQENVEQNEQQYQIVSAGEGQNQGAELENYYKLLNIQKINDDLAQQAQAEEGTTEKPKELPRYKYTKSRPQYKDKEYYTPYVPKKASRPKVSNENTNSEYVRFLPNYENENLKIAPYQALPLSAYRFAEIQADVEARQNAYAQINQESEENSNEESEANEESEEYTNEESEENTNEESEENTNEESEENVNEESEENLNEEPQRNAYNQANKGTQRYGYNQANKAPHRNAYKKANKGAQRNRYSHQNKGGQRNAYNQANKESKRNGQSQSNGEAQRNSYKGAQRNAYNKANEEAQRSVNAQANKGAQRNAYNQANKGYTGQRNGYTGANNEGKQKSYNQASKELQRNAYNQAKKESGRNGAPVRDYIPIKEEPENQALEEILPVIAQTPAIVNSHLRALDTAELKKTITSIEGLSILKKQQKEEIPALRLPTVQTPSDKLSLLLAPLYQHKVITDTIARKKEELLSGEQKIHSKLQELRSSSLDTKQYATEIEKLTSNLGKQNVLAEIEAEGRAAISKTPAVLLNPESVTSGKSPVIARIPKFEGATYPLPLQIIRQLPTSEQKEEKAEEEKPVSVEVQRQIHIPGTTNVYVNVNNHHLKQKEVPASFQQQIPERLPSLKPEQITILRHIWEH